MDGARPELWRVLRRHVSELLVSWAQSLAPDANPLNTGLLQSGGPERGYVLCISARLAASSGIDGCADEVFTTGGMPPLVNNPDPVYDRTYRKLQERNAVYYSKYPQDVHEVRRIMAHLQGECVSLPSGGRLTEGRFQELGHAFGGHGGIDTVHRTRPPAGLPLGLS